MLLEILLFVIGVIGLILLFRWVDEYNNLKAYNRPAWEAYCREYGFTLDHDAYDCMA